MVNSLEFAKRLQKILDYYGISATAFSDEIEVNRSTISHLLSGRNKPSLDFVLKVIQHYPEVELYWLLNGKGSFPAEKSSSEENQKNGNKASVPEETLSPPLQNQNQNRITADKDPGIDRIVIFYKDGSFKSYNN
jgi:transcriptional regulator with XRE-family HTH domain